MVKVLSEDEIELERFRDILRRGFSADPWARVGGKPSFIKESIIDFDNSDTIEKKVHNVGDIKSLKVSENLAISAVKSIVKSAETDVEVAEALNTTVEKNGVTIGNWRIKVRQAAISGKNKKHYDVLNVLTGKVIFRDLLVYEAALAIVRQLNLGKQIDSPEVNQIVSLEEIYTRNSINAISYRRSILKAKKDNQEEKEFNLENRLKIALQKAQDAELNIIKLSKTALR